MPVDVPACGRCCAAAPFVRQSVTQLRGNGGVRQIKGEPRVAVAASGGGPLATALLLTRD